MENTEKPLPPLRRDLDVSPYEHEGKSMFLVRDREGLLREPIVVSPAAMIIASLLDGRHTADEVRTLFAQVTGTMLDASEIRRIADDLAGIGLLQTPQVVAQYERILEEFTRSPVRRPIHQGNGGYPENRLELSRLLGTFFRDPQGPGADASESPSGIPPAGLVSPHIDFSRGGPTYAWAYQALSQTPPPDVVVALGVAHVSPDSPWIMTPKAYETPYGPVSVDAALYDEIKSCLWYDARGDEWAHRSEHSLEFQAVWLKFLWGDKTPPWVPILCSSFERFCDDRPPSTVSTVENAIEEVGEKLARVAKKGRRVLVLAGVDLAHVGPCFGDEKTVDEAAGRHVEAEDRRSLDHLLKLDADGFYMSVVADDHWRKVCGLSALYTAVRWIKALNEGRPGSLLAYGQAADPRDGIVSFASAIFR